MAATGGVGDSSGSETDSRIEIDYANTLRQAFMASEITTRRICDICIKEIPLTTTGVECTCSGCGIRYDVCGSCRELRTVVLDRCPEGYGCKRSDSSGCTSFSASSDSAVTNVWTDRRHTPPEGG